MESSNQMIEARIRDLYWKNKHPISRYFERKKNFIVEDRDVDWQISNRKTNLFFSNFFGWIFVGLAVITFFLQVNEVIDLKMYSQILFFCIPVIFSGYYNKTLLGRLEEIKHLKELLKVLKKEEKEKLEKLEKLELVLN